MNNSPEFTSEFEDQLVNIGESLIYFLPSFTDEDSDDEHVATLTLNGGGSLPAFFTFTSGGWFVLVEPD